MQVSLHSKLAQLKIQLKFFGRVCVAYSGGTDSAFLLAAAHRVLGAGNVLAVTAVSETFPPWELPIARRLARLLEVEHQIVHTDELTYPSFVNNSPDRCYHCKYQRFRSIKALAQQREMVAVEGSNADDGRDYRPGRKAVEELAFASPLLRVGLTKDEIRLISKEWGLPSWNIPSQSCLATRIAYGIPITLSALHRIAQAEQLILNLGLDQVRVRDHGDLARIEVPLPQLDKLLDKASLVNRRLKELGFIYVTVDLNGYVGGSMNLSVKKSIAGGEIDG